MSAAYAMNEAIAMHGAMGVCKRRCERKHVECKDEDAATEDELRCFSHAWESVKADVSVNMLSVKIKKQ